MRDRQPTKPGRVLLTPENGDTPFYAIMEMADEPTEVGTPPTTANLLTDETEIALFGSAANRTVNQAFAAIGFRFKMLADSMASLTVTVKDGSGLAAKDVQIEGMYDETGGSVYTNASGVATGYVAEGNVTLRISGYADIEDASDTFTAVAGGTYTRTITVTRRTYLKLLSSANFRFSGNVATVDVALGGGGAGGSWGTTNYPTSSAVIYQQGGTGGGAGQVAESIGIVPDSRILYSAIVGAGGAVAASGGASSFMGVSAAGGSPNAGGTGAKITYPISGSGAQGSSVAAKAGSDGTKFLYASMTETFLYGGNGGGGGANGDAINSYLGDALPAAGGSPGGGKGYLFPTWAGDTWGNSPNGKNGLGGGGGGAGSNFSRETANYPAEMKSDGAGKGGSGCITVRIHLIA